MKVRWIIAAALCAAMPSLAETNHPTVETFGNLPSVGGPSISPDGKHLALIQAYKGRPVATVWTLEPSGGQPLVIPYEEGFIDRVQWANDHRLLIRVNLNASVWGEGVNPWHRTVSTYPETKESVVLFSNKQEDRNINYSASQIVDLALNDPDHVFMPLYAGGGVLAGTYVPPRNTLFRVDINTGRAQFIEKGGPSTQSWIMDGSGNLVARLDESKDPLTDHILAYTPDQNWREIASTDATNGHGFSIYGVLPDGKSLVLGGRQAGDDTEGLMRMSLADGKESALYSNPIYDTVGTVNDPWSDRVLGAVYTSHLTKIHYFEPELQQMQTTLESFFPGMAVQAVTWDQARNKIVVNVEGPMSPPAYYIYNRQTDAIQKLGRTYGQLQQSDLGPIRVYNYAARDGLEIPAYLTLPPGKEAKNLPVVIMPHGGPMARDDMSFDWESQFLANRGYAVLRPNFRGSSGYGRKFEEAGYGQWGLKMQDDITDGVKKLIADGIADPKRICIVGGSYGGYAALAGVTFTPDLYACAAAWAPVTDLRQFLATRSIDYGSDSWMISTWTHYVGDRWHDANKLDAASPSENAAKIKAPVLIVHGEADATVRIDQSERMERALRRAGKKVTFIRVPKETHYMQTAGSRILWLTELEKFLKENIGN